MALRHPSRPAHNGASRPLPHPAFACRHTAIAVHMLCMAGLALGGLAVAMPSALAQAAAQGPHLEPPPGRHPARPAAPSASRPARWARRSTPLPQRPAWS
nr:hypothetical protein [Delftia lacustris]